MFEGQIKSQVLGKNKKTGILIECSLITQENNDDANIQCVSYKLHAAYCKHRIPLTSMMKLMTSTASVVIVAYKLY